MNLKAARQKYLQLGKELEALPQSTERQNLMHTHSKLGIFLDNEVGEKWRHADSPSCNYDKEFGDDKLCNCGHPYYRHFDTYEDMENVGCKYCSCHNWKPFDTTRTILKFSDLQEGEFFTMPDNGNPEDNDMSYMKTILRKTETDEYNAICFVNGIVMGHSKQEYSTMIRDDEEVEKIVRKY